MMRLHIQLDFLDQKRQVLFIQQWYSIQLVYRRGFGGIGTNLIDIQIETLQFVLFTIA